MYRTPILLFVAILTAASAACGSGFEAVVPGPERLRAPLDEDQVGALARILRYEDRRRYDPAAFERLVDGDVEVRRRAAMAAGRIGDSAAVPLLVRLLGDDPSAAVQADAAFALGELGDTSHLVIAALRDVVPPGWVPPRDDEATVVVEVIHALGKLGTFEARGMVLEALRSARTRSSEGGRRIVAEALLNAWRFSEGSGRVSTVVRYLDSPDDEMRWRAAYALMRMGEPRATPRLVPLLDDTDHRARAYAARGLTGPGTDSAGIRDTAVAALGAALGDPHPHVRINAVQSLAGYGEDAPVDRMVALLEDDAPHVAVAAAGALAGRVDRAEADLTAALADPDRPLALRAAAAGTLADAAPDTVLAHLEEWAESGFMGRYVAARGAPAVGWDRAAPLIRRLAADDDLRVAVAAVAAAGTLAADTTAPIAQRDALRALLGRLARGERRRVATVALRGLEPLLSADSLNRLGIETGAAESSDPDTARSTAFYEDVVRTYVAPVMAGEPRPRTVIRTRAGEIVVELLAEEAPLTVRNFVTLARDGFWDDGVWHRVLPNFVLQDGAPAGDPSGGPGWSIRDEINRVRYVRGVMGMALSGPDTGGSQWFITHSPQHHLDGGYTIFGRVVGGMDAADAVLQGDPIESIRVPR